MLLAPPRSGPGAALRLPPAAEPPPIDERLVRPEKREQIVRGRRVLALPANPAHGDRHFELDYIIRAHVKEGYVGSTDLLTRSAERSDFATDTCVRRAGLDPRTDTRYLEELAFEVVNEQSLRDITEQAEDLTARGVRRVVAIFVKKGEVCDLLDAAEADNAVARALLAKNNPVLTEVAIESHKAGLAEGKKKGLAEGKKKGLAEGEKKGLAEGEKQGLRRGIEVACDLLGIELTEERRARLIGLDASGLEALLAQIRAQRRWP
jgi:hypothetical protein